MWGYHTSWSMNKKKIAGNASQPAAFSLEVKVVGSGLMFKDPKKVEYLCAEEATLAAHAAPGWILLAGAGCFGYFQSHAVVVRKESVFSR